MDTSGNPDLATRVRQLREARHLSRYALAKRAGLTHPFIKDIEEGKTKTPSYQTLEKLAKGLGIRPAELLNSAPDDADLPDISVLPGPIQWLIRHSGNDLNADDLNAILEYAEGRIALKRSRTDAGAVGYQVPQVNQAEGEPPADQTA